MNAYRYTECGLDDVFIEGCNFRVDDVGEDVITIPNINGLHRAIAEGLVTKPSSLTGKELRFLRTEIEMTQAELATVVHREPLAISRWERGEVETIDANAEALIRLYACEALKLKIPASVKEIASYSIPSANTPPLVINGEDPQNYRPMPRAA
jgi:transcriptional regulator with XRE-family HTH domain